MIKTYASNITSDTDDESLLSYQHNKFSHWVAHFKLLKMNTKLLNNYIF
jgi:hypothetical protein